MGRPGCDLKGQSFGKWSVVRLASTSPRKWLCRCSCGREFDVGSSSLLSGDSKGCKPCSLKGKNIRHGMHGTSVYNVWCSMMKRCYSKTHRWYSRYGGRGIKVCKRWHTFENFYSDMGDRGRRLQIDRIDNSKGYNPDNCRWTTGKVNLRNRDMVKLNTEAAKVIRHSAKTKSKSLLARLHGVHRVTINDVVFGQTWVG